MQVNKKTLLSKTQLKTYQRHTESLFEIRTSQTARGANIQLASDSQILRDKMYAIRTSPKTQGRTTNARDKRLTMEVDLIITFYYFIACGFLKALIMTEMGFYRKFFCSTTFFNSKGKSRFSTCSRGIFYLKYYNDNFKIEAQNNTEYNTLLYI